jgi:TolB-like protein
MRCALLVACAVALGTMVAPVPALHAQDDRPGVAVWTFDNGGSYGRDPQDFEALRVGLQQMLLTELAQNSELRIVERSHLREIIEEQDLGTTGRVEPETAARVGRLVGARYMVLGSFIDWYGDMRLDTRVVDTETSEVLSAQRVRDDRANMYDLVVNLGVAITEAAELPALSSAVLEQRRSRDVPAEAMQLYANALLQQDLGLYDEARELLRQITQDFPQMVEAQQALEQLPSQE